MVKAAWTSTVLTTAALALSLSACAPGEAPSDALLTAAEAGPKYQQLSTDIREALNVAYPGLGLRPGAQSAPTLTQRKSGECVLSVGDAESKADVHTLAGGWEPIMDSVNGALKDAGFASIAEEDSIPGGWTGISSKDSHGAELRIVSKSSTELTITATVSDANCTLG